MIYLAMHHGRGAVHSGDIANRQAIPEAYLEKLLATLRRAGLIHSKVGPQGGHILALEPSDISLADVVAALEGDIHTRTCKPEPNKCAYSGICAHRDVWDEIELATQQVLRSVSIAELARRQIKYEEGVIGGGS